MNEDKTISNKILGLFTFIVLLFVSFIYFIFIGIAKVDAQNLQFNKPTNIGFATSQNNLLVGAWTNACSNTIYCGTLNDKTSVNTNLLASYDISSNITNSSVWSLPVGNYSLSMTSTIQSSVLLNSSQIDVDIVVYRTSTSRYSVATCDTNESINKSKYADNSNRWEISYNCDVLENSLNDITFIGLMYSVPNINYIYVSRSLKLIGEGEATNSDIITNQNQNTQDIINNQNQNTQEIIINQNQNTQNITNKLDQVDNTNKGILSAISNFFGNFFGNLINSIVGIFLPNDFDFLNGFLDTLENKLGFIASVPIQVLEFLIDLVTYQFDDMTSITLPEFSVLNYDLWDSQEIDLTEIINTFHPYRIYTNIACVSLCAYYLMKLYENFASGGGN